MRLMENHTSSVSLCSFCYLSDFQMNAAAALKASSRWGGAEAVIIKITSQHQ